MLTKEIPCNLTFVLIQEYKCLFIFLQDFTKSLSQSTFPISNKILLGKVLIITGVTHAPKNCIPPQTNVL